MTTAPDVQRTQRPKTVVVRLEETAGEISRRSREAISTLHTPATAFDVPATMKEDAVTASAPASIPEPTTPKITAPPVVSALLGVAGVLPFGAGSSPVAPAQSPLCGP